MRAILKSRILPGLFMTFFVAVAFAQSGGSTVVDPLKIKKILSQIPLDKSFKYGSLADRITNVGLTVDSIRSEPLTKNDIQISIDTNAPNSAVRAICPIAGSPVYIKRGNKYIPQNRTAYWLMTNRCDFR